MNILKDLIDYLTKLFTWWVVVMPWEQGIRVTLGKKAVVLNKGIYLKLPLIHQVYVQEKRMRVIVVPIQTLSTADGHVITISCSVAYSITDIFKLYNTLYQPDMTISNLMLGKISEYICTHKLTECRIDQIEYALAQSIKSTDYGLTYEYVKIVNFASVKTFRLIQDSTHLWEGLDMLKKS
jgi:Membrane protease subunits, stomatin/prohibitin homologs